MFVHKYMNFNWVNTHNRYWSFRYKFIQSRCKQFHVLGLRNEGYLSKTWLVFTRKLYLKRTKLLCDFTAWVGIKTTEWECLLIQESVGRISRCHFSFLYFTKISVDYYSLIKMQLTKEIVTHTSLGLAIIIELDFLNKMLECNHSNGINHLVWFFALWEIKSSTNYQYIFIFLPEVKCLFLVKWLSWVLLFLTFYFHF